MGILKLKQPKKKRKDGMQSEPELTCKGVSQRAQAVHTDQGYPLSPPLVPPLPSIDGDESPPHQICMDNHADIYRQIFTRSTWEDKNNKRDEQGKWCDSIEGRGVYMGDYNSQQLLNKE